jgi:ABC-2 type transport system ATP-binding protein
VLVRTPQAAKLSEALRAVGSEITEQPDGALLVNRTEAAAIGEVAAANGIVLHELSPQHGSLEEAFMEMTKEDVQFHAPAPGGHDETVPAWGGSQQ